MTKIEVQLTDKGMEKIPHGLLPSKLMDLERAGFITTFSKYGLFPYKSPRTHPKVARQNAESAWNQVMGFLLPTQDTQCIYLIDQDADWDE